MAIPSFTIGQVLTASQQNTLASYAVPTGSVTAFAGSTAPTNFLLCDGTAVSRTTYAELFALISTTYGIGDGSTTFNVPNLKGRMPVGADSTQTEFDTLAETGGAKTVTLTDAELPPTQIRVNDGGTLFPLFGAGASTSAGYFGRPGVEFPNSLNTGNAARGAQIAGGGGSHNNLQPYIVLNYIIKT
jgi:microcystin-dependent protein